MKNNTLIWVIGTVVVIGGASAAIYYLLIKPNANQKISAALSDKTQAETNTANALLQTINGKTNSVAAEYVKVKGSASKIYGLSNAKIIAIFDMLQKSKFVSPEAEKAAIDNMISGVSGTTQPVPSDARG
jgi:hypothetical protein